MSTAGARVGHEKALTRPISRPGEIMSLHRWAWRSVDRDYVECETGYTPYVFRGSWTFGLRRAAASRKSPGDIFKVKHRNRATKSSDKDDEIYIYIRQSAITRAVSAGVKKTESVVTYISTRKNGAWSSKRCKNYYTIIVMD